MKYQVMHLVEGPRIQPVTRLVLLYVGVTGDTNLDRIRKKMLMNTQEMRAARHELHRMGLHPGVGDEIVNLQKIPEVLPDHGYGELVFVGPGTPPPDVKLGPGFISTRNELREEVGSLEAISGDTKEWITPVPLKAEDVANLPVLHAASVEPVDQEAAAAFEAVEQAEAHMRGFHNLVERLDKEENKDERGTEVRGEESEAPAGDGGGSERARGPGDPAAGGQEPDPQADHEAGPALGDGAGPVVAVSRRKGKGKSHI